MSQEIKEMMNQQEFKQKETGKISKEWDVVTIEEICKVRRGASPRPIGDPSFFSHIGRGWIRISDVTETYKFLRKTSQYLSKKGEERSVKVNPGDLIMSICATIGKPIILDMKACIHDGFVWFSELSSKANVEYLFYVLQKNEITFSSKRQTGTQGNLNTTLVGKTLISLPPLPEQQKIAEILSTVDMAIEKADEAIEKTQRVKKGLMQELLTGRRQTVDSKQDKSKREFKDTEIGRIPKEWEVVRLEDACIDITDGSHFSPKEDKKGEFKIATVANIKDDQIDVTSCKKISKEDYEKLVKNGCKPKFGDILFSKDGTVGLSFSFKQNLDIALLSSIAIIRPKVVMDSDFCAYVLKSPSVFRQITGSKRGTGLRRIILKDLKRIKIPLPEEFEEQQKIAEILNTVDKRLSLLRGRKEKLKRIKKGLMNDLLSGKVRVKVD